MSKIRVADVLFIPRGTPQYRKHFNKINAKHIDFLLCDPGTLAPRLAIELDDSSHNRADRRARDEFLNSALTAAHLPFLRLPVTSTYNPQALAECSHIM